MIAFAGNLPQRLAAPWNGQLPMPFDLLGSTMDVPISDDAIAIAEQAYNAAFVQHQQLVQTVGVAWGFVDWSSYAGRGPILGG